MNTQRFFAFTLIAVVIIQPVTPGVIGLLSQSPGKSELARQQNLIQKTDHNRANTDSLGNKREESHSVHDLEPGTYHSGEVLVKFRDKTSKTAINRLNAEFGAEIREDHAFNVKTISISEDRTISEMIRLYEDKPIVKYAEPNYMYHACMVPNDPLYSAQWHLHGQEDGGGINVELGWDIATGVGTTVAVVDTGVARGTDLQQTSFTPGYDFVNDDPDPTDYNGHGTHVAGTIAQSTNNDEGVAGVAFGATLMPVKVLNAEGKGEPADVADGIKYAVDNGADIINLSLGSGQSSSTIGSAIQYANSNGVLCVAASGNDGEGEVGYPAAYDSVVAVGATQYDKNRASYSNYGPNLDLVAPGGNTQSDQNNDGNPDGVLQQTNITGVWGYEFLQGTSMATPHVSGFAALIHSNGTTNPDAIREIMRANATDLGAPGKDDQYGYGLINVGKTFVSAKEDDEYEANDVMEKAYDLSKYEDTWLEEINGTGIQGDTDWYQIFVNASTKQIQVELEYTHQAGNINLQLYDANESLLKTSETMNDNEAIGYNASTGGVFYLKVYGEDKWNEYDLWWNDVKIPEKDEGNILYENGLSPLVLAAIGLGIIIIIGVIVYAVKKRGKNKEPKLA